MKYLAVSAYNPRLTTLIGLIKTCIKDTGKFEIYRQGPQVNRHWKAMATFGSKLSNAQSHKWEWDLAEGEWSNELKKHG